jgi:hypothetical protein
MPPVRPTTLPSKKCKIMEDIDLPDKPNVPDHLRQRKGQTKKAKSNSAQNVQHREIYQRLSFLHQAAVLMTCTALSQPLPAPITLHPAQASKQVQKMDPAEWRNLTKGKRKQLRRKFKRQTLERKQLEHAKTLQPKTLASLGSHYVHHMKKCAQKLVIRM